MGVLRGIFMGRISTPTVAKGGLPESECAYYIDNADNHLKEVTPAGVVTDLSLLEVAGTVAELGFTIGDEATAQTTGTAKFTFRMPFAMTVTEVRASLGTAPTDATFIVDINDSGATILSTKLSIDATEKTSTTAAVPAVISDAALADDAQITVDIDQIGSTIAGAGLKIWFIGTRD